MTVHGIIQSYDLNREIDSFGEFYKIKKKPWDSEELIRFDLNKFDW